MKREKDKSVVIAIDISSGLDSTSGEVADVAVKADLTITLAFLKTGLFLGKGREVSGEIAVADISIPKFLTKENQCKLTDDEFVRTILPRRTPQSSKQANGKVLIIAGSQSEKSSMMGAAMMATSAAIKSGAGYLCAAVPPSAFNAVHTSTPEAIVIGQDEQTILERIAWADAVLIGCGLGRTPESQSFIAKLLTNPALKEKKVVIDADALYAISELGLLPQLKLTNAILTPHLKEFERLIHVPTSEIDSDRLYYTKAFINEYPLGLLLKGVPTLIAAQGKLFMNNSGTEALATAGTGDVLAGLIVSLAAQGLSIENAAAAGAYLHGLAGQHAGKPSSRVSATDVIGSIEAVMNEISS
jgi:ADP-dependent NAD(P)H-hydrate dehydratase / NAD(P)H-hydrate epimerase